MREMIDRLETMLAKGTDNMLLRFSLGKAYAEQECYGDAETHLRASLVFSLKTATNVASHPENGDF